MVKAKENEELMTAEQILSTYGFTEDRCHGCGLLNTEISGYLMQCGKCRKAYYCSMKCFNEDLPRHVKFCDTAELMHEPERSKHDDYEFVRPPKLSVEELGKDLYKVKVFNHSSLTVKGEDGHEYESKIDLGTYLMYTKSKTNKEKTGKAKGKKTVVQLYGSGPLTLTAANSKGKTVSVTLQPAKPNPPKIQAQEMAPGIYKVYASDPNEGPLTISAEDEEGNKFQDMEVGHVFQYDKAMNKPSQEAGDVAKGIRPRVAGMGKLILTATNEDGVQASVKVKAKDPEPPKLKVKKLGENLYRLEVIDPTSTDGPVEITAADSNGNPVTLADKNVFSYFEGDPMQAKSRDKTHGAVTVITGNGDLDITATNCFGKKAKKSVAPCEVPPPNIEVEPLGNGLYKVTATDPLGQRLKIDCADDKGHKFVPGLENSAIFSYLDAGNSKSKQAGGDDATHGEIQKLRGHGNLTVTATNPFGKKAEARVQPEAVSPPAIEVKEIEKGVYRLVASDESGDPLTFETFDEKGNKFDPGLENSSLFTYTDAGGASSKQETGKHPTQRALEKLRGHGVLTITATNSAGVTSKAQVQPGAASPPVIQVKELEKGVYKLVASDESGDPLTFETFDKKGNKFEPGLKDSSIFTYTDAGKANSKQDTGKHPTQQGELEKLRGHGDLTITATNSSGVTAKAQVKVAPAPPPVIEVKELGNGFYKLSVTDESGDPVTIKTSDGDNNPFENALEDKAVFSYIEAGKRPNSQDTISDVRHGDVKKLLGQGDLTITAINSAGKKAQVIVNPTEAPPPHLEVQDLGTGLCKVVARDQDGEPVSVFAKDSEGNAFEAEPGMVFRYMETDGDNEETNHAHPAHGDIKNIYGKGDLTFTATNPAGKEATATVNPTDPGEPVLDLKEVEPGVYIINATDPNGDPVEVEAEDGEGKPLLKLPVKSKIRYSDVGPEHSKKDGDTFDFQMPELWITCYNKSKKKKRKKVKPAPKKERKPRDPIPPLEIEEFKVSPPASPKGQKPKKRVLTREIRDKLIFWYGRLGHPTQDVMKKKVAKLDKACGITPEDVDLLPWIINGRMLRTRDLHDKVMEDTAVWHEEDAD